MLVVLLSACGFHMAGPTDLDPVFDKTHVSHMNRGRLMAELVEDQFEANKSSLTNAEEATALVTIQYERTTRDVIAVDEAGKVAEYALILEVGVRVTDAEKKKLLKDQKIRLSRDFLFDVDEVLGKGKEQAIVYQEMREDAARLIIHRLQAIKTEV